MNLQLWVKLPVNTIWLFCLTKYGVILCFTSCIYQYRFYQWRNTKQTITNLVNPWPCWFTNWCCNYNHNHFKLLMDTSLHNSTATLFYHKWLPVLLLNECGYLDNFVTHLTKVRTIIVDELNTIPNCIVWCCYVALRILPKPRKPAKKSMTSYYKKQK
jgi:hypothetical protein